MFPSTNKIYATSISHPFRFKLDKDKKKKQSLSGILFNILFTVNLNHKERHSITKYLVFRQLEVIELKLVLGGLSDDHHVEVLKLKRGHFGELQVFERLSGC